MGDFPMSIKVTVSMPCAHTGLHEGFCCSRTPEAEGTKPGSPPHLKSLSSPSLLLIAIGFYIHASTLKHSLQWTSRVQIQINKVLCSDPGLDPTVWKFISWVTNFIFFHYVLKSKTGRNRMANLALHIGFNHRLCTDRTSNISETFFFDLGYCDM